MTYTSFVYNPEHQLVGFGKYSRLEMEIHAACRASKSVYILNVARIPQKGIKNTSVVDMGESIDLVISGDADDVQRMLEKLPSPVGITRYTGELVELAHAHALSARDRAEERKLNHFFYDVESKGSS